MARNKTGILELDEMLRGGFMDKDAVMVAGSAGTGKTTLGLEYLVNGATQFGDPGIYLTFEQDLSGRRKLRLGLKKTGGRKQIESSVH
jgi:KaiC/GvpD/RAD55 family RecA-like ATPase